MEITGGRVFQALCEGLQDGWCSWSGVKRDRNMENEIEAGAHSVGPDTPPW